jgi:hypothetical protein
MFSPAISYVVRNKKLCRSINLLGSNCWLFQLGCRNCSRGAAAWCSPYCNCRAHFITSDRRQNASRSTLTGFGNLPAETSCLILVLLIPPTYNPTALTSMSSGLIMTVGDCRTLRSYWVFRDCKVDFPKYDVAALLYVAGQCNMVDRL